MSVNFLISYCRICSLYGFVSTFWKPIQLLHTMYLQKPTCNCLLATEYLKWKFAFNINDYYIIMYR